MCDLWVSEDIYKKNKSPFLDECKFKKSNTLRCRKHSVEKAFDPVFCMRICTFLLGLLMCQYVVACNSPDYSGYVWYIWHISFFFCLWFYLICVLPFFSFLSFVELEGIQFVDFLKWPSLWFIDRCCCFGLFNLFPSLFWLCYLSFFGWLSCCLSVSSAI